MKGWKQKKTFMQKAYKIFFHLLLRYTGLFFDLAEMFVFYSPIKFSPTGSSWLLLPLPLYPTSPSKPPPLLLFRYRLDLPWIPVSQGISSCSRLGYSSCITAGWGSWVGGRVLIAVGSPGREGWLSIFSFCQDYSRSHMS